MIFNEKNGTVNKKFTNPSTIFIEKNQVKWYNIVRICVKGVKNGHF